MTPRGRLGPIAWWRISSFVSVTAMVALIIAACSPAAPASPTAAASSSSSSAAAPTAAAAPTQAAGATTAPAAAASGSTSNAPIKLTYLGVQSPDLDVAFKAMMAEYNKTHPNVTVEFQTVPFAQLFPKIEASVAAKTPIDIILADGPNVQHFAYEKAIVPLDQYFPSDYAQQQWSSTSLRTSSYKGKFYAPPMMESCSVMWYNKDMTDKAGVTPPATLADSWTMDQALVAWQKTTNAPQQYGLRWGQGVGYQDYEYGIFRRSAGTKTSKAYQGVSPDGLQVSGYFDSATAIKGHQFSRDIVQKYHVSPVEQIPDIFFVGKAAFYVSPDNAIGTIQREHPNGDFHYGVTPIPYFSGGSQVCHTDSWHYAISPNSQNVAAAADVIKFWSGPVGSKILYDAVRQLPANVNVLNSLPEYQDQKTPQYLVYQEFKAAGVPRILTPGFSEYNQAYMEFATNIVEGQNVDVAALAHATAQRVDGLLAKYK
jgi:fructooligosaccharide transport system substrate-binding protein